MISIHERFICPFAGFILQLGCVFERPNDSWKFTHGESSVIVRVCELPAARGPL
jgi:hypothetical protein